MTEKPLSKSEFGRRMGAKSSTVAGWVADGRPLRPDGKVDEAAARHWVTTRLDGARRATRKEETSGGTVSDLRARKLSAEADLLEMKRRKRAGELVECAPRAGCRGAG